MSDDLMVIRDWDDHFENNRTRELKVMTWIPLPNKQDGDGYTELLDHPDGAAHFGAWVALVQVASRCGVRGTLLRDSAEPHDSTSLSRMTRIPQRIMSDAIERLIKIGWIERKQGKNEQSRTSPQEGAGIPQGSDAFRKGMEGKGMEGNQYSAALSSARSDEEAKAPNANVKVNANAKGNPDLIYAAYPRKVGRDAALRAIKGALERLKGKVELPAAYLLAQTLAYAKSPAGQKSVNGRDYRPHPATWFNQGRFDDDKAEWQRTNGADEHAPEPEDPEYASMRANGFTEKEIQEQKRVDQAAADRHERERKEQVAKMNALGIHPTWGNGTITLRHLETGQEHVMLSSDLSTHQPQNMPAVIGKAMIALAKGASK